MRVYVLCSEMIERITLKATLVERKVIKKIYSKEGIYYLSNNILYKQVNIVGELPCEEHVNKHKVIVDKNTLVYEPEHYQLSPDHISEIVTQYIYSLSDNKMQFSIEKHSDEVQDEAYFNTDNYTDIIKYITDTFS